MRTTALIILSILKVFNANMTDKLAKNFSEIWPKPADAATTLQLTAFGKNLLEQCKTVEKPQLKPADIDLKQFMTKSANFPVEFGTNTCRIVSQPPDRHDKIKEQIVSAYPIIHERVLGLYLNFLEHKTRYGTDVELKVFEKLSLTDFVSRLLNKRCVCFMGSRDSFLLITGEKGNSGFEAIGSKAEKSPLLLKNVLSYDEIKLSAFLSVSSHSEFLNNGNRYNKGTIEVNKSTIETEGIIMGLIGARFERAYQMEWQDILITRTQNTNERGYGSKVVDARKSDYRQLWQRFYQQEDQLYEATAQSSLNNERFIKFDEDTIFDRLLMSKRFAISFDTLLLEAEARAGAQRKMAFVHVVGLGLGVWQVTAEQKSIFLETFEQRLRFLLDTEQLSHVGAIRFAWFRVEAFAGLRNGEKMCASSHPNGGICILFNNDNPADKLTNEYAEMLPVVSYAWDGNALPGNEFWLGSLSGSGDPAAACSTLITELHNGHINEQFVNGNNLHIATLNAGILHISDYSKRALHEAAAVKSEL